MCKHLKPTTNNLKRLSRTIIRTTSMVLVLLCHVLQTHLHVAVPKAGTSLSVTAHRATRRKTLQEDPCQGYSPNFIGGLPQHDTSAPCSNIVPT